MFLEEHNVLRSTRSGFCVYDSRGFDIDQVGQGLGELTEWMANGVHHHQLCSRPQDDGKLITDNIDSPLLSSRFKKRQVNQPLVVAEFAEIYPSLMEGDCKPLESAKRFFNCSAIRNCNKSPILILTHGDMLMTEERIDGRIKICNFLGISEITGVYDIVCLTEHGLLADESDPVSGYALTETIYRALFFSDRGHSPKKKLLDWVVVCVA